MADYGTIATTVATVLGVGGAVGGANVAVLKWFLDRRESKRTWHRDHLIERYTETRRALLAIDRALSEHLKPLTGQSPMPSLAPAYPAIAAAVDDLIVKASDALVVARSRAVFPITCCMNIDRSVLVPYSRPQGIPPIADHRLNVELRFIGTVSWYLLLAMRADLDLIGKKDLAETDARLADFEASAQASRSLFAAVDPVTVVANLESYKVAPIWPATTVTYLVPSEDLETYCAEWSLHLPGTGVQAVLICENDGTVYGGVRAEMSPELQVMRLRQIGQTVEAGFHTSFGSSGWRDLQDGGGRIWTWS